MIGLALVLVCFASHPAAAVDNTSVATGVWSDGPISFLGCYDTDTNRRELLVVNQTYHCKFGWRSMSGGASGLYSAVAVSLTGYSASELSLLYDEKKLKKVALGANLQPGSKVKLIQVAPFDSEAAGTWFDVQFHHTACVQGGQSLQISVEPLGDEHWPAVSSELHQQIKRCQDEAPKSGGGGGFAKWLPFLQQTSQASTLAPPIVDSTRNLSLGVGIILLLVILCCCCLACFYTNPYGK